MKLTIDREADALYLNLDESPPPRAKRFRLESFSITVPRVRVAGIEMLHLSKRVSPEKLNRMQLETVGV